MRKSFHLTALALLLITYSYPAGAQSVESSQSDPTAAERIRPLVELEKDDHLSLGQVQIFGENPSLVYLPIIHDGPLNKVASTDMGGVKTILRNCEAISDHLYESYGIKNILLEGVSKQVADRYNEPGEFWQKLSWGKNATITYDTWGKILRSQRWHLVPAFDKKPIGPLTLLGREYNDRIHGALRTAKEQGWFKSREIFVENQAEFSNSINKACEGYNEKLRQILEDDPGLKKEYEITVARRNEIFLDNIAAAKGPGVVLCGKGHFQDLVAQLEKRGESFVLVVPEGMEWPPTVKDEETIFNEMKKLGCQLKEVTLKFGDGTAAKIKLPIE